MVDCPVREIVLYKHGVGFFRREGTVTGERLTLAFREDEINDVLKSLAVFDQKGGQVLGIHYQTPMDKAARLADSSIRLSGEASLFDLLKSLRGREVELELPNVLRIRGRLVGVDAEEEERAERSLVSIIDEANGQVRVIPVKDLRGIRLHDERAEHDLHYFLDTSMRADIRREVTISLSGGSHKLTLYYVAPSPTWRVTYRLIAEPDQAGDAGRALLQGWGLFDNRLDEDLKDVQVTLVAGQPISFIYDLYASRIPRRPVIEDKARVVEQPPTFEAAMPAPAPVPQPEMAMMAKRKRMAAAPAAMDTFAGGIEEAEGAVQVAAQGEESGEFFRYEVTTPVSVKRGESALVPIIGSQVHYSRELLYNRAKLPDHPVAALRFKNTTGLTLERGPVTVVEDNEYLGEAILPFTRSEGEVYLPYAVELGVRISERPQHHTEMAGLNIHEKYLLINEYQVQTTRYLLENNTSRDLTVTLESPISPQYELFETPAPDEETAAERRWRVAVRAHSSADFMVKTRRLTRRHEEIRSLDYRRLQRYLKDRWLDQASFELLTGLLDNLGFIQNAQAEQDTLIEERGAIYERQEQLRKNLSTLKPGGDEGALRGRMLDQLAASEDRLAEIELRYAELDDQIAEAEAQIEQALNLLGGSDVAG